ncbi:MAG: ferritin family protein [candidate division Zixibacteria bacterium]|nr:ferritin family protein [candidate division Zixibacteria bacterium]
MDIIKFAMQMEMDGKKFYEKAAEAAAEKEVKEILLYLAEEEVRHFNFFKTLKEGGDTAAAAKALEGGALSNTKNVFVKLIEQGKDKSFGEDTRATWQEARVTEEKSVKVYADEAAKETDPQRKSLLNKIADEERNHVYLIDNMLLFMADPQSYSDSRGFSDFMSWEGR